MAEERLMLHIVVAVLAVNLVQGLTLAWGRQFRLASLSSSVNPTLLLYVISSLMSQSASWPNITRFEVGFLSLQVLALALSLVSLSGVRVSPWLFWTAWALNGLTWLFMVYMVFFFRIWT
ncbi:MAG TPA: hypothetical protein VGR44_03140 [Methylomirabilota bacterium]|jgi:hypothetical protein|nr:hypothetical protein [Methylomirabilota bacterium]